MSKSKPGNPERIEKYLAAKFGSRLDDARQAMAVLAAAHALTDLYRRGFRLCEQFRPSVPAGENGWVPRASWGRQAVKVAGEALRQTTGQPFSHVVAGMPAGEAGQLAENAVAAPLVEWAGLEVVGVEPSRMAAATRCLLLSRGQQPGTEPGAPSRGRHPE